MPDVPIASPGDVYGYWTLIERIPGSHTREPVWVCRCTCGKVRQVIQSNLRSGKSRGCGCRLLGQATKTHGQSGTPLYGAWRNMLDRCYREGNKQFHDYGGRGIRVHLDWHTFEHFARDVGPHPGPGHTLDRIDNSGDYVPGNVRWSTWSEQSRNKRTTNLVEFDGRTQCLSDWARDLGVTSNHISRRIRKGMSVQEALQDIVNNPPRVRGPYRKKRA